VAGAREERNGLAEYLEAPFGLLSS